MARYYALDSLFDKYTSSVLWNTFFWGKHELWTSISLYKMITMVFTQHSHQLWWFLDVYFWAYILFSICLAIAFILYSCLVFHSCGIQDKAWEELDESFVERCATLADCRLADLQTCRLADSQTCRLADSQTCRLADLWRPQTMWHWITRLCHAQNVIDPSAKMDRSGELNFLCSLFS